MEPCSSSDSNASNGPLCHPTAMCRRGTKGSGTGFVSLKEQICRRRVRQRSAKVILKTFAVVVSHYAKRYTRCFQRSATQKMPTGKSNKKRSFLYSTPFRRLKRILDVNWGHTREAWLAIVETLSPADALILSLATPWNYPIKNGTLMQVLKGSPTLLFHLFSDRPSPGSLG
ncbi:hypothetical protein C3747_393g6 [Trypanosoma cruzi]|uniref:Uncharacterized protein n=1 Tax=Trypanosoma cruzi TaxID=5693 RepID=A0A2V2V544_TRYCR|nr:hypothetical protein C3747_393g6 [Trypanosoma cruzi]